MNFYPYLCCSPLEKKVEQDKQIEISEAGDYPLTWLHAPICKQTVDLRLKLPIIYVYKHMF
jgi:hypothetical protein